MKSELITIDSNQLPVIEWQNVRVVTTETLASGYGTEASNIRMNLSNNKSRFIEGIHYFNVTGEELAHLRVNNIYAQISNKARAITLYTEKGAARMSKIVDTDEAWSFFEKMESAYFNQKSLPSDPTTLGLPNFLDPAESAIAWAEQHKKVQLLGVQVQQLETEIDSLKNLFQVGMTPVQFCKQLNGVNINQVNLFL
ncbi:MAG TPA: ORF6N domain-containing protein [Arsenophonus nasoniae]|uniref:ORF6N domain-containing protein n=1 Tax=Arsenophonus nasoniae TaxID=638 RepID=UPI0038790DFD